MQLSQDREADVIRLHSRKPTPIIKSFDPIENYKHNRRMTPWKPGLLDLISEEGLTEIEERSSKSDEDLINEENDECIQH